MAPQRRLDKVKEILLFHGSARSRDFSEFMDWLRKLRARRFPRDERLHFDQRLDRAFGSPTCSLRCLLSAFAHKPLEACRDFGAQSKGDGGRYTVRSFFALPTPQGAR